MASVHDVLDRADDYTYEEDVARNPYSIRHWWTYIQAQRESPAKVRDGCAYARGRGVWPPRASAGPVSPLCLPLCRPESLCTSAP